MGTLTRMNKTMFRVECDCDRFVHDVFRNDKGELEMKTYKTGRGEPPPERDDKPKQKPSKKRGGFFGDIFDDPDAGDDDDGGKDDE